jgi:TolB-like protein
MDPKNFFGELKRRNVYKVAIAYAIVAWLLIQAASILFPTFEAPSWMMKIFVTLAILGFPIALLFAWAFELTPEGLKRTEDVDVSQSTTRRTGRKLDFLIIAVLLLVIGVLIYQRLHPTVPSITSDVPEKSIAVLPFENRSEDKANAYFADGIQDEILTRLAKIADLKVISRTSTQHYKSAPENLPEIAKELGVAHILEGSVQKSGDSVRVNVQLIKAANDSHLWADSFDRKLTDIFSVETEVAKAIADQLRAKLSGQEEQVITAKPTDNTEALRCLLAWAGLHSEGRRQHTGQYPWRTEILQRSGAAGPEVRSCLGAAIVRGWARLPDSNSSTNSRFA